MFRTIFATTLLLLSTPLLADDRDDDDRDDRRNSWSMYDDKSRYSKAERREAKAERREEKAERRQAKAERRALKAERWDKRGERRAKTNICDPVKDGTPGLYGLCVSYCEARDIDDVLHDRAKRHLTAEKIAARKDRVLKKYNRRKQAGDPDMPCVSQSVCPCWASSYTSSSYWMGKSAAPICVSMDQPTVKSAELLAGSDPAATDYAGLQTFSASADGVNFQHYCSLIDNEQSVSTFQEVSATDAMVCGTQVQSTCGVVSN